MLDLSPCIFVVVPAYNEGKVIRNTLRPILRAGFSVVVVDDGSTDNTHRQLQGLGVYLLAHPFNMGQGAALQTGVSYALRQGAEFVVHFDADGQHSPKDIIGLLEPVLLGKADVALGSRFLREKDWREVPFMRRVLLKAAIVVNWLLAGLWLTDAHNGARAFSRSAATRIFLHENGFAHATEILQQIHTLRLRYVERPTRIRYTNYSKLKGQPAWNAVNILVDLLVRRWLK